MSEEDEGTAVQDLSGRPEREDLWAGGKVEIELDRENFLQVLKALDDRDAVVELSMSRPNPNLNTILMADKFRALMSHLRQRCPDDLLDVCHLELKDTGPDTVPLVVRKKRAAKVRKPRGGKNETAENPVPADADSGARFPVGEEEVPVAASAERAGPKSGVRRRARA